MCKGTFLRPSKLQCRRIKTRTTSRRDYISKMRIGYDYDDDDDDEAPDSCERASSMCVSGERFHAMQCRYTAKVVAQRRFLHQFCHNKRTVCVRAYVGRLRSSFSSSVRDSQQFRLTRRR